MNPDMSRRIAAVLGVRPVKSADRQMILDAAEAVSSYQDLPAKVQVLLGDLAGQPTYQELLDRASSPPPRGHPLRISGGDRAHLHPAP